MTSLSVSARVFLALSLVLFSLCATAFYARQNRQQAPGGPISPAKLAWLAYTVFVWFILCPLLALAPEVAYPLRRILGSFALGMWGRGLLELYMLYVRHNWRPPFGIAHNLLSMLLVLGLSWWYRVELAALTQPFDVWVHGLLGCVLVSLGLEMWYARVFDSAVAGQTTGRHGVWFATQDDARFVWINRVTRICNVPLYGFLVGFLGSCFGLW